MGTVVNRTWESFHRGSLEITLFSVPLRTFYLNTTVNQSISINSQTDIFSLTKKLFLPINKSNKLNVADDISNIGTF